MQPNDDAGLYGLLEENSSRYGDGLWGKNQFNSTFPLSLCLYMRDRDIRPVSVLYDSERGFYLDAEHWSMADILGDPEKNPTYQFEAPFVPYVTKEFSKTGLDKIDLVVSLGDDPWRPLEVKLTVVPDSATADEDEEKWAPELVIRPVTSAYAMMSVADSIGVGHQQTGRGVKDPHGPELYESVKSELRKAYNEMTPLSAWDNQEKVVAKSAQLRSHLKDALGVAAKIQKPFLVQPIWKTRGQSFVLSEYCLDVFVWSDVALMMLPVALNDNRNINKVARSLREVARHVKALYELLTQGDYDYNGIYKGMSLGLQTDKGFAMSGKKMWKYMHHERLERPKFDASVLYEIILGGGHKELQPERRFDAAVKLHMDSDSDE